jgi:hypothetical protein
LVRSIRLDKLVACGDNPNEQSKVNFGKLVRNIERTGRYEPLTVRRCPGRGRCFEVINGYHRWHALARLGHESADCIVWDVDDDERDILLATLNRLGGRDNVGKKASLLKRLAKRRGASEVSKLVPQSAKQIERLVNLKGPRAAAKVRARRFANPVVFFVTDEQQRIVEDALLSASKGAGEKHKASKRAVGLMRIAEYFINSRSSESKEGQKNG